MPGLRERFSRRQGDADVSSTRANDPDYRRYLQKRIKFMYMNPCDKVRAKRRFPWKLFLQIVKLILVTTQMSFFGATRSSHVDFLEKSNLALRHMYLQKWDPSYETLPYPPATGEYAVYTIPEFYDYVNYAMRRYDQTEKLAIGTYHFERKNHTEPKMWMCKEFYRKGKINATMEHYEFDARHDLDCFKISTVEECDYGNCTQKYDIKEYLHQYNKSINFDRIIRIHLNFTLMTVHLKELSAMSSPDCFQFGVKISYINAEHNGQMPIMLTLKETPLECKGTIIHDDDSEEIMMALNVMLDVINICISVVSFILCSRSIIKSLILLVETSKYCKKVLHISLTCGDTLEFFQPWYWVIIINDVCVIAGSIVKITIELKASTNYEAAGAPLGLAGFFVWMGVLRYFTFFNGFNVIMVTLKKAFLRCLRFLLTSSVIYLAFAITGWVILGPYNTKFRHLSTTMECLFSLVNGDDMFVTFSIINDIKPKWVWWFSRIYLYTFIGAFIYIVLNIFLVIIIDAYDTYKLNEQNGCPKTALHQFVDDSPDYLHLQMSDRHTQTCKGNMCCFCQVWCNCCLGESDDEANEYVAENANHNVRLIPDIQEEV